MRRQEVTAQERDRQALQVGEALEEFRQAAIRLRQASSLDPAARTSSAAARAAATDGVKTIGGSYEVDVLQLAARQITASTVAYSAPTDTVSTGGSISFTINGSTTAAISISGATSLSALRDRINDQNSGVVASIENDAYGYRLILTSADTGLLQGFQVNNTLTNSNGTAIAFESQQNPVSGNRENASDAVVAVNGLEWRSHSNVLDGAVGGVTLTATSPGKSTLTVGPDADVLKGRLKDLAEAFNKLREIRGSGASHALEGVLELAVASIQDAVRRPSAPVGAFSTLEQIGLSFDASGKLSVDEARLDKAVDQNAGDVRRLLRGSTGSNGAVSLMLGSLGAVWATEDDSATSEARRDGILLQQQALDLRRASLEDIRTTADAVSQTLRSFSGSLNVISSR